MKVAELKPGVCIHCCTEEDASTLLDALTISYGWEWVYSSPMWNINKGNTCYTITDDWKIGLTVLGAGEKTVEFSELELPLTVIKLEGLPARKITKSVQTGVTVHCNTQEKASVLLKYLSNLGFVQEDGSALQRNVRTEHSCYCIEEDYTVSKCDLSACRRSQFTVTFEQYFGVEYACSERDVLCERLFYFYSMVTKEECVNVFCLSETNKAELMSYTTDEFLYFVLSYYTSGEISNRLNKYEEEEHPILYIGDVVTLEGESTEEYCVLEVRGGVIAVLADKILQLNGYDVDTVVKTGKNVKPTEWYRGTTGVSQVTAF